MRELGSSSLWCKDVGLVVYVTLGGACGCQPQHNDCGAQAQWKSAMAQNKGSDGARFQMMIIFRVHIRRELQRSEKECECHWMRAQCVRLFEAEIVEIGVRI